MSDEVCMQMVQGGRTQMIAAAGKSVMDSSVMMQLSSGGENEMTILSITHSRCSS